MSTTKEREDSVLEAKKSLERMQKFDPTTLSRESELGVALNFREAVPHARRLIDLYLQLPLESVEWFNQRQATQLKSVADSDYNLLQQILSFDPNKGHGQSEQKQWINEMEQTYEQTFQHLAPWIAYGVGRVTDFTKIGRDARATIQDIEDKAKKLGEDLEQHRKDAQQILDDIRKVAAEQGVSQQAVYFKDESESHAKQADEWLKQTKRLTLLLALYAILTLVLHKIPWIAPTTSYEAIQLAVSKVLVFTTIAYFLILSAKNFIAHRHNAIVNKHRQNALVTYRALVDAAGDGANRDIVLTKAAECIFGPQPTGFGRADAGEPGSISMVSVSPGAIKPSAESP
jgi:hypothetical protein